MHLYEERWAHRWLVRITFTRSRYLGWCEFDVVSLGVRNRSVNNERRHR